MNNLKYLNLDHNPLGQTPDFSRLPGLSHISLKDTGLTQIPHGLLSNPPRQAVNLSKNAIEQLPDELFALPSSLTSPLDLSGNPLSPQTLESIKTYCQRTGESFADLLDTRAALSHDCDLSLTPLSPTSPGRLRQYYQRTGVDFQVEAATVDSQGTPLVVTYPDPEED